MISFGKFSKLREITKYFHIAEELESLSEELVEGKNADMYRLEILLSFLVRSGGKEFVEEIRSLLSESDPRKKFEKTHFLYHSIKEHFGYPEPEGRFIATTQDRERVPEKQSELVIILENIRSAFNAGSIIRSCECFGAGKLVLAGITPGIDNPKVLKTAKGTEKYVTIERTRELADTISGLKSRGYIIAGAETGKGSISITDFIMPEKTAFVFGNEEIGITSDTLKLCDYIVSIKMSGMKNSLNVASAAAVFMYEYSRFHSLI